MRESTALSEKQQKRAIDNLIGAGLIRCELRGMPAKRGFYIVEDVDNLKKIIALGEEKMREIKPNAAERYEKKRRNSENPDNPKRETEELMNFLSESLGTTLPESENRAAEIPAVFEKEQQENVCETAVLHFSDKRAEKAPTKEPHLLRQKVGASSDEKSEQHFNKSKYNKLNIINPINQSENDERDMIEFYQEIESDIDKRAEYLALIRKNISYDYLAEKEKYSLDQIDELVNIMLDAVCSTRKTIRVNREEIPREVVKSRFLKLDDSHIDYVLTALKNNAGKVRNIRAYLTTMLYNSYTTVSNYYSAMAYYDMREGNLFREHAQSAVMRQ